MHRWKASGGRSKTNSCITAGSRHAPRPGRPSPNTSRSSTNGNASRLVLTISRPLPSRSDFIKRDSLLNPLLSTIDDRPHRGHGPPRCTCRSPACTTGRSYSSLSDEEPLRCRTGKKGRCLGHHAEHDRQRLALWRSCGSFCCVECVWLETEL